MERIRGFSSLFLRLALGLSFLSALADRFGLWGAFGRPNVSWGSFARFVAYTGKLNEAVSKLISLRKIGHQDNA